jgi:hypothetical protein
MSDDELDVDGLQRPARPNDSEQLTLLDVEPSWVEHYWGMPCFVAGDAQPNYRLVVNLMTLEDLHELAARLGVRVTATTRSIWYPPLPPLDKPSRWAYVDE